MKPDPRVAILHLIGFFIIIFLETRIGWLTFIMLMFLVFYLTEASYRKVLYVTLLLLIPSVIILILNILFVSQDSDYLIVILIRFWGLAWLFNWFLYAVDPDLLTQALVSYKIPYKYAWQVSLAYRFLPMFQEESLQLYNAQISRGIPLDRGMISRLRFISSIIIPLVVMSQDKSNRFAEALTARDWDPDSPKAFLNPLKMEKNDWLWISSTIIIFLMIILL
ncbi:MAG: energy-coupling factor transporter transmembrane protein EcfT [Candidatus Heimdallarchaeota archaeon]|nr:energy-coupling factor transporter transmembrane protein EcfT [Candidatus Heimdallarchaeota archaeon]